MTTINTHHFVVLYNALLFEKGIGFKDAVMSGVNVNATDILGKTILHHVMDGGYVGVLDYLLECVPSIDIRPATYPTTPLTTAILNGKVPCD